MAFNRRNLSGNIGVGSDAPKFMTFRDDTSTKAQVAAADYFLGVTALLEAGDGIYCACSDGTQILNVASATALTVTTTAVAATV